MSGFQAGWRSIPVGERDLRFSRLPPGQYVLRIRKLGAPDAERPTTLRFEVLAPFYRQRWFLALAGLLTGLFFYLALRVNEHRLRRRNQELESAVRGRTWEIEQANERLRRSVELKERLVSIISHDIVTPLRFIARVARTTAREASEVPGLDESLNDIAVSSDKLYANAHNMLSWIKHQEGRIELRPMHVALNPLVEEALDVVRALARSQGDVLINDVPLDDVLRTDRDVVLIILQNLISNAVNYTRNGRVVVHGSMGTDHYELSVADTGPGITPKALAHVRDILSGQHGRRGMDHGDPEMQGLGYVIIGELAALLGGNVEVDPREGGGTRVTLRLPLRMEQTGPAQEGQRS
jgi:signal transduction histidine kinase